MEVIFLHMKAEYDIKLSLKWDFTRVTAGRDDGFFNVFVIIISACIYPTPPP